MNTPGNDTHKQFLEMYDGHSDEIFRFCLAKTHNRDLALDITQETFVKTWDYLRTGKTIDAVRGFLYRTARNLIIDQARRKKPVSLDAFLEDEYSTHDVPDSSETPQGASIDKERMMEQLRQLPEHHYEILILRFIQELTISEIASMYKESENTVSVRIHRALKHAQKLFPEHYYE